VLSAQEEQGGKTNFQMASVTINASVQIYSSRVDSVHSDAYRILGGLSITEHVPNRMISNLI
jgi:condensin complex subunit 2